MRFIPQRLRRNNNNNRNSRDATAGPPAVSPSSAPPPTFQSQTETLIPAEVRMISGCHSQQTSADVSNIRQVASGLPNPAGRAGGACTSALLEILYQHHQQQQQQQPLTFQDLLLQLRSSLREKGLDQIPQLTSSRPLELQQTPFSLVGGDGTGQRRALLVGINYRGQSGQLSGCHNDVYNMKRYIESYHGYREVTVLMDDGKQGHQHPTRQTIIAALQHLVRVSRPGDSIYFHYSGHGGLLAPQNAFKQKNHFHDETLIPLDHQRTGHIRDFNLFHHFVKPLAAGVTATCVMDCCHSGAVLELPYSFQPTSAGTIMMRENFSSLSNLAFLYILAGGMLPHHAMMPVQQHLEETVDGDLDEYQGTGVEDFEADGGQFDQAYTYGEQDYAGADDTEAAVVDSYGDTGDVVDGQVVDGSEVVGGEEGMYGNYEDGTRAFDDAGGGDDLGNVVDGTDVYSGVGDASGPLVVEGVAVPPSDPGMMDGYQSGYGDFGTGDTSNVVEGMPVGGEDFAGDGGYYGYDSAVGGPDVVQGMPMDSARDSYNYGGMGDVGGGGDFGGDYDQAPEDCGCDISDVIEGLMSAGFDGGD